MRQDAEDVCQGTRTSVERMDEERRTRSFFRS